MTSATGRMLSEQLDHYRARAPGEWSVTSISLRVPSAPPLQPSFVIHSGLRSISLTWHLRWNQRFVDHGSPVFHWRNPTSCWGNAFIWAVSPCRYPPTERTSRDGTAVSDHLREERRSQRTMRANVRPQFELAEGLEASQDKRMMGAAATAGPDRFRRARGSENCSSTSDHTYCETWSAPTLGSGMGRWPLPSLNPVSRRHTFATINC